MRLARILDDLQTWAAQLGIHNVEILGFFCHSDFTWNQFGPKCFHFEHMSSRIMKVWIKETFCKKIKWKMEFDHIFWFPSIVWKNFKKTECAYILHQNKTTERRQIQLVLSCQKYWSNSIFHFIFLQKVSFIFVIFKCKIPKKSKFKANVKMAVFDPWNQPKLLSHKIKMAAKWLISTLEYQHSKFPIRLPRSVDLFEKEQLILKITNKVSWRHSFENVSSLWPSNVQLVVLEKKGAFENCLQVMISFIAFCKSSLACSFRFVFNSFPDIFLKNRTG